MPHHDPFFIVGSGRSGTTLLRLLLNGHSRLHIPPETWFLSSLVKEIPIDRPLSPSEIERAIALITQNYRWPDMKMETGEFTQSVQALTQPTLLQIIDLIYDAQLAGAGKIRFGDKTPPYIHIVPQLLALYPEAKFIHLVRDGRDVAISFLDAGFYSRSSRCYSGNHFEWTAAVRKAKSFADERFADRILTTRYEDLVSHPEQSLRVICDFLGEAFEPQMLNWQKQTDDVPSRERHIHKKLAQPISDSNVETWRRRVSSLECFIMESCLGKDLRALDYPLRFHSPAWIPLMSLTAKLFNSFAPALARASAFLRRHALVPKNSVIL